MIRFALVVASVLGFVLTAALGNMMVPLLRSCNVRHAAHSRTAMPRQPGAYHGRAVPDGGHPLPLWAWAGWPHVLHSLPCLAATGR